MINGNRAPWIREGVEYFPKAMYQADRFHVKGDLKQFLSGTEGLKECLNAFDGSDSKVLMESLFTAIPEVKGKRRQDPDKGIWDNTFRRVIQPI